MTEDLLFLLHLWATLFLCGLIWVVQVVHYPLFDRVDANRWPEFAAAHRRRISLVVVPAMVLEAVTAVALVVAGPLDRTAASINLLLLVGIWSSTAFLQVPAHARLESAFDPAAHRRLVGSNWIRTVLWTLRAAVLAVLAARLWGLG